MNKFKTVDEIFAFAIGKEEEAFIFYTDLSNTVKNQAMKVMFEGFAREEQKHKEKLIEARKGGTFTPSSKAVADLKIADFQVDVAPGPSMGYQDALILAMKKEKQSFSLYTGLAGIAQDAAIKELFLSLAREEAIHKLKIELEYDENVLTDN